jgi:hypothetical protein
MKTKMSYFVKFENGTSAWLAAGKEVPAEAVSSEERPMLFPEEGKVLRHKRSKEFSTGHWLRNETADAWEEISDEEYKAAMKEREAEMKAEAEKRMEEAAAANK